VVWPAFAPASAGFFVFVHRERNVIADDQARSIAFAGSQERFNIDKQMNSLPVGSTP